MKPPWRESSPVNPVLFWIAMLLLLYAPFKAGVITFAQIESKKDLIDALSTLIGVLILLIGGTLSYIRFFRGRTLKPKIDLDIQSGCLPNKSTNLFWLEIAITNTGSVSLWNYRILVNVRPYPLAQIMDISNCIIRSSHLFDEHFVDVGTTSFEHVVVELDRQPQAYTFEVALLDGKNTIWQRYLTVENP